MTHAANNPANAAASSTNMPADDRASYERLLDEARQMHGVSLGRDAWRRLKRNRAAMAALSFLVLLGLSAVFTPLLPLQPPRTVHTARALGAPEFRPLFSQTAPWFHDDGGIDEAGVKSGFGDLNGFDLRLLQVRAALFGRWEATSWCGCDNLGRDLLARLFWGARISLVVGIVAALVSLVIGVSYGATSGYIGGYVDSAMMRAVDVLYSIPFIFVVIMLITVLDQPEVKAKLGNYGIKDRITIFFFVVGAIYWLTMARVVRGQVLSLKQEQFVEAARTIGASRPRIIFLHLVSNLLSVIIVYLTLTIPRVMLFEAFLSFLGLGVQAPDVSWGVLANEGTQSITPVHIDWWLVVYPGLALGSTLFALNFLGDGLRDALDPRLKNR